MEIIYYPQFDADEHEMLNVLFEHYHGTERVDGTTVTSRVEIENMFREVDVDAYKAVSSRYSIKQDDSEIAELVRSIMDKVNLVTDLDIIEINFTKFWKGP